MRRDLAVRYGELQQWHWWFRGRQRILETVLRRTLGGRRPAAIASLGSGPADGLAWLQRFTSPTGRVVALDTDPLHARTLVPRLDFVIGSLEAAPLATESFDVVLALDVLEHIDDDVIGLRESARLLKPGGLLLVTVPALPSLWSGHDLINQHRRRYTKSALQEAFVRAHLHDPSITYFNTLLFPACAGVRWLRRALGRDGDPRSDFDGSRPGWTNEALTAVFAAERHLVGRVPLPVGVSLLASWRSRRRSAQ